jgi:hypothetical protein
MKKSWLISRRTFLGGGGSLIALPLLEQMIPSFARRAAAAAPPAGRLVVIHWPTGTCPGVFQPTAANGAALAAGNVGAILQPLAAANVLGDTTVVTNLANKPAEANQAGDHARGTGAFLTCTQPPPQVSPLKDGVSVDYLVANALGTGMRLPGGLFLGTNGGGGAGNNCDSGYSCAYQFNTSWGPNSTPIPEEDNPLNAFNRVFTGYDPGASQAQIQQRLNRKKSILDYSMAQATSLQSKLNPRDSAKLDEYLTGIRDYETRLQAAMMAPACSPGQPPPAGIPADIQQHVKLMLDLTVLTLSCDITPTVTFSYENTVSERQHTFLKTAAGQTVTDGWHIGITHGSAAGNAFATAEYQAINTWFYSQVAYLVGKLKAVTQPDGTTLLDRTIVYSGTELGVGGYHDHRQLRLTVSGGKALGFNPGRHIVVPDPTPLANLYLTFLQTLKVPNSTAFGDSNGTIAL